MADHHHEMEQFREDNSLYDASLSGENKEFPGLSLESPTVVVGAKIDFLKSMRNQETEAAAFVELYSFESTIAATRLAASPYLLPIDIEEQFLVADHKELLGEYGIRVLISSVETIEILNNKEKFSDKMEELGIASLTPRTMDEPETPCIIKRLDLNFGREAHIYMTPEELSSHGPLRQNEICQEYIAGNTEYTAHILASKGAVIHEQLIEHTHLKDIYVQGIESDPVSSIPLPCPPELKRTLEGILKAFEFSGICSVDFKLKEGALKVLEINPRVGASLGTDDKLFSEFLSVYRNLLKGDFH